MAHVTKAKQMAQAIVNVVKQNNRLYFYTAQSSTIPKTVVCLDNLAAVEVTKDNPYGNVYNKSYDVKFKYSLDNPNNNIRIHFPCQGTGYVWNSVTKRYDIVECNWEKETEEIIENVTKLV
jgi:hypothetical protein